MGWPPNSSLRGVPPDQDRHVHRVHVNKSVLERRKPVTHQHGYYCIYVEMQILNVPLNNYQQYVYEKCVAIWAQGLKAYFLKYLEMS